MFESTTLVGHLLTGVGVVAAWYFGVTSFRREDVRLRAEAVRVAEEARERQHRENQTRLNELETCFHRHLGKDDDEPIRERILKLERDMEYLRKAP